MLAALMRWGLRLAEQTRLARDRLGEAESLVKSDQDPPPPVRRGTKRSQISARDPKLFSARFGEIPQKFGFLCGKNRKIN